MRDVEGPGANVATLDETLVDHRLSELISKLGHIEPVACCAGAAGAEIASAHARLEKLLTRLLPECRVSVVHDARLVLAAAGLESGIALIAGTGSVAFGRTRDGREAQRGGWGWMVGDEGSAVWITREAVRVVMARTDAGEDVGALGKALLERCGVADPRQLLATLHGMHEPMQWAALASSVFDMVEVDSGARDIVDRAAGELARLVADLRETLHMDGPVVLAGGLLLNQPKLESAVRDRVDAPCIRLQEAPVEGAVRLAEALMVR